MLWRLKSSASRLFSQPCVQVQIKGNTNFRVTGFCEKNHRWPMYSPHKGSVTRKMFLFDDVVWYNIVNWPKWNICLHMETPFSDHSISVYCNDIPILLMLENLLKRCYSFATFPRKRCSLMRFPNIEEDVTLQTRVNLTCFRYFPTHVKENIKLTMPLCIFQNNAFPTQNDIMCFCCLHCISLHVPVIPPGTALCHPRYAG